MLCTVCMYLILYVLLLLLYGSFIHYNYLFILLYYIKIITFKHYYLFNNNN